MPSPSIVPSQDLDTYFVLDNFGRMGSAWREADQERTTREAVITDLLEGQFSNPVRVICFNNAEGWSRDVSDEIARELLQQCADQDLDVPEGAQEFVDRYARHKADREIGNR